MHLYLQYFSFPPEHSITKGGKACCQRRNNFPVTQGVFFSFPHAAIVFESHWGQGTIPLLTLTLTTITTTQLLCKQASSHLEDTSTMQTPSKKKCLSYALVNQCTV
jgi:hypothetical protein